MRIISGEFGGRRIQAPANFKVRPTTDRAKESLFNILNNMFDYEGLHILDLFAGIGSLSYEFSSRGVESVTSVEKSFNHASFISSTAEKIGANNIAVIKSDVRDYLKTAKKTFDIIFADPPFDLPWIDKIPELIFAGNITTEKTLVIVEHPAEVKYNKNEFYKSTRKYGKVHFSMFEK